MRWVTGPTGPNPPSSGQPDKGVRVGGRGKDGEAGSAPALPVTSQWQTPQNDGCHLALCRLSAPLRWGRPFVPKCRHTSALVSRTYYLGRRGDRCPVLTSTSEPFNPHARPRPWCLGLRRLTPLITHQRQLRLRHLASNASCSVLRALVWLPLMHLTRPAMTHFLYIHGAPSPH